MKINYYNIENYIVYVEKKVNYKYIMILIIFIFFSSFCHHIYYFEHVIAFHKPQKWGFLFPTQSLKYPLHGPTVSCS